jgi:hypothetical protein
VQIAHHLAIPRVLSDCASAVEFLRGVVEHVVARPARRVMPALRPAWIFCRNSTCILFSTLSDGCSFPFQQPVGLADQDGVALLCCCLSRQAPAPSGLVSGLRYPPIETLDYFVQDARVHLALHQLVGAAASWTLSASPSLSSPRPRSHCHGHPQPSLPTASPASSPLPGVFSCKSSARPPPSRAAIEAGLCNQNACTSGCASRAMSASDCRAPSGDGGTVAQRAAAAQRTWPEARRTVYERRKYPLDARSGERESRRSLSRRTVAENI